MTIVTSECDCDLWGKIGAQVDNIPECVFGGIHYFKNKEKAAEKWVELTSNNPMYWSMKVPYHWAVHYSGKHVVNVHP